MAIADNLLFWRPSNIIVINEMQHHQLYADHAGPTRLSVALLQSRVVNRLPRRLQIVKIYKTLLKWLRDTCQKCILKC